MSQDLRTPAGRFANFLKASEHWGPDLLLGSFNAGLPEIVVSLGDMRGTYAELVQLAARVAELEAERETDAQDVRAVAEACADSDNDEGPRSIRQLYARFADRIAALGQQNDAATRCCECGSSDVTYRNYLNQPFCGPCADGRGPVDGQDDTADGSAR